LVGLDNGNQSDVTAFKSNKRKAFAGRLLVTVLATGMQGEVTLALKAANFNYAEYSTKAISPTKKIVSNKKN